MVVTWFLGAWMSNTATTILMLPIALAVISLLNDIDKNRKFVRCLLLSVAYWSYCYFTIIITSQYHNWIEIY